MIRAGLSRRQLGWRGDLCAGVPVDPVSAAAEVGAEFRRDVEEFVSREALDACTVKNRHELSFDPKKHYFGFVAAKGIIRGEW